MILDLTPNEVKLLGEAINRDLANKIEFKFEAKSELHDILKSEIEALLKISDKIDEAIIKE